MKNSLRLFAVIFTVILLAPIPLYHDWNWFTVGGYGFQSVKTTQEILDNAEQRAWWTPEFPLFERGNPRSFIIINSTSPFDGEIITFLGRDVIYFSGEIYYFSIQIQRLGFEIWFLEYSRSWFASGLHRLRAINDMYDPSALVLASAVQDVGSVHHVGHVRNFLQVMPIPALLGLIVVILRLRTSKINITGENDEQT